MAPITFEWRMSVSDYQRAEVGKRIWSKPYSPLEYSPLKFYLRVFPHGDSEENSDYITYYLYCSPPNNGTVTLQYNLYILDHNGNQIAESPWTGEFSPKHQTWGKRKFVRRPIIDSTGLENDFITFGAEVTVINFDRSLLLPSPKPLNIELMLDDGISIINDPIVEVAVRDNDRYSIAPTVTDSFPPKEGDNSSDESDFEEDDEGEETTAAVVSKYSEKIANLFKNMDLTDVNIHVGDEIIKAHKLILFLNSPCLRAMLKHATSEYDATRIDIEDFSPKSVHRALEFMYTETIVNFKNLAPADIVELGRFAFTFEFGDFKTFIESQIHELITSKNACDFANLSVCYNQESIRSVALDFITENLRAIKLNDTFEKLSDKNAKDVLRKLC